MSEGQGEAKMLRIQLQALGRECAPSLPPYIRWDMAALVGRLLDYEAWTPPARFSCRICGAFTDRGLYDEAAADGSVVVALCEDCMALVIEEALAPEAVSE